MITVTDPTTCRLTGIDRKVLEPHLRYIDKRVDHEIARLKRSAQFIHDGDSEKLQKYQEDLANLREQRKKTLLFEDDNGLHTLSGLAHYVSSKIYEPVDIQVNYPEPKICSYVKEPKHPPRPYQVEAHDLLLAERHAAVEMGTGLGKSRIIEMITKSLGLKTVIMAPAVNIAEQLHAMFLEHFGKPRVGAYFAGKKDSSKQITVAVAASLMRTEKGTKAWKELASSLVFIADESHMTPAETLRSICLDLFADTPYRFFFSGTQTRTDGQELVLQGITGRIVYRMTVREGVDGGWLAKPLFRVVPIESNISYNSPIVDKMTNKHLRYNPQVLQCAAMIANKSVGVLKRQTVILIDEMEQFSKLLPLLRHRAEFAHGTLTKDNRRFVPEQYWKSDPHELVERFNRGEIPILVGTSCISTGTDIQTVGSIIYLVGGMSEIAVKQAVGRGTRGGVNSTVTKPEGSTLWPWGEKKADCYFWDFDVRTRGDNDPHNRNLSSVGRHSAERRAIYEGIYGPVQEVKLS